MIKAIIQSVRMLIVLTLLTGVAYPVLMTVAAQAIFPAQANGSLAAVSGANVGSTLIGQPFVAEKYFAGRPTANNYGIGAEGAFNASGGSNQGPTSDILAKAAAANAEAFRTANGLAADVIIPPEMVFASASGLDPHISPEAARLQIDRVARVRGLDRVRVVVLVEGFVEGPQLGIFGQPRVNVLKLNIALDALK